ncbi:DUF3857 domain-containing protein [Tenacibaculum sp. MEBiC06402]|uniref:DUF3857 domain-containing protein n=1 Tax=unclassified Tenacibaculum TaxID=2635139 RepID=UPI003B9D7C60
MKKEIRILLLFLITVQLSFAQSEPFYKTYDWDKTPAYNINVGSDEEMGAVKEKIATEFYFEGDSFVEYFLEHKILWLNSDDKIEQYNKVYLPFSSNSELVVNKARVINTKGEVIDLDESKILTATDEETGRTYKYFAFEGVTKGSYIEYMYVVRRLPIYKGLRLSFQSSYDKDLVEFDLFSPKNLVFKFKSINDFPEVERDTTIADKGHWTLKKPSLKKIVREKLAAYDASRGGIIYKLDANVANGVSDISGYSKVSQNLYKYYYAEIENKTSKLIDKLIKELDLEQSTTLDDKLRRIDFFLKTNYYIADSSDPNLSDIKQVLDKKVANDRGIVKLFIALFKKLNIKHELVITCDRDEVKFDKKFEANTFLKEFLFYFPKTKKYLSPDKLESRYGFPPAGLTDNYGLFIKEVTVGEFNSAIGKIKYIKPIKAKETKDIMTIDISFDPDNLTKNIIHYEREFYGYYALSMQPFIHLIKGDDREKMIDGMAETINKEIEVTNRKLENDKPELFGEKPLRFIVDLNTEALVENAGRKYLFKLGEIIGRQIEMYQEEKRTLKVEEQNQRSYYRTIKLTIPEGYKISNLDDINIDNSYKEKNKEYFAFKSSYEVNGNVVTIKADEHYRKNIIPVALYEEYRTVINSAADFNKIVLLLEPK